MLTLSTTTTITMIFILFILIKVVTEVFLAIKNSNYIYNRKDRLPEQFKDKISLEDHQKAATYSVVKLNSGIIFLFVNTLILLLWTLGGGLDLLNMIALSFNLNNSIFTGLIFFSALGLISFFLGLPESIYYTFVIEEKFGFNKTTPKLFIIDLIKGGVLSIVIGLPILAAVLWIMKFLGSTWWIYAWGFLTLIQIILMVIYPIWIAPLFNKFSPLEDGEVKDKVLDLLKRTGFLSKGLFVMDASKRSSHGNAYFTGFGKNKRIVFFDTLIKNLDPDEVEAVLAHELGHFKKKHILKTLVRAVLTSLIGFAILGYLYQLPAFFQGHGVTVPSTYMALVLFGMVASIYTFLLTPLFAKISRKYEFEADEFTSQHADPSKLISALVKLYKDNASTLTPDPTFSTFYHSHPPAITRVKHLEKLIELKNNKQQ